MSLFLHFQWLYTPVKNTVGIDVLFVSGRVCVIFFLDCLNIAAQWCKVKFLQHECRIKVTCFLPDVEWLPAGFLFVLHIIIALFVFQKSAKNPKAQFQCKLCKYNCDSVAVSLKHIHDKRHRRLMEVITHSDFVAGFWKGTLKPFEVITVE